MTGAIRQSTGGKLTHFPIHPALREVMRQNAAILEMNKMLFEKLAYPPILEYNSKEGGE